jgi:hypothetical protein
VGNWVAGDSPVGTPVGTNSTAGVSVDVPVKVASVGEDAVAGVLVGGLVAVGLRKGVIIACCPAVGVFVGGDCVDVAGAGVFVGGRGAGVSLAWMVAVFAASCGVSVAAGAGGTSE